MPLFNITELSEKLSTGQRLLGIDPGAKTVGLALSDVMLMVASPYGVLKREKLSLMAQKITEVVREQDVGALVVGLPLSMDGGFGPAAQAARDWAQALSDQIMVPAILWDERFSSSVVNRTIIGEADLSRKRRAEVVDKMAAAYMLQGALDYLSIERARHFSSFED
ncbi:MAG: Holliday junction resolvase RuvX [Acetobacter aceti]|uniref:Putative pre-16S rRNA nuclease n=1 Tax=Acetobacter aceti TaxID=435 RepID=A0A1U9KKH6_ACEAC|nr:Holliday junction resolvase RuvX [Acetobacter aceti]AQS86311.1 crossover junction endodeoxyribonuclease RuvA [Acetobacter aceti]